MKSMRKKIIATAAVIAFLVTISTQSVAAYTPIPGITITAWTDKTQYAPGEKGKLKISILNSLPRPVDIREIYIEFPWYAYNAQTSMWEGNETIKGTPVDTISSEGGHYYREVEFTVPNDGRATALSAVGWSEIMIDVDASEGKADDFPADLLVMSPTVNMALVDMDRWMTILTVAIVICTIIIAAVVFLSSRAPRIATVAPRA